MDLFEQLRRDEGLRLKPYLDQVNKLTIGYGRNLDDEGISQDEADYMLRNDAIRHAADLSRELPWTDKLDPVRQAVLINMAFNMGVHGLMGFRNTLAMIQAGNYAGAANGMLQSKWTEQVGPRAHRLAKQMESGEWV